MTLDKLVRDVNIGIEEDQNVVKLSKVVPKEYQGQYLKLFKSYEDLFTWSYQDLKAFEVDIINHKIHLKEDMKPHKQKLRKINPLLLPAIEKEAKKLLHAKVIFPLGYSEWVANLAIVR